MPLVSVEHVAHDVILGVWRIGETETGFMAACPELAPVLGRVSGYRSAVRRLEVLAVYALLFRITGDSSLRIAHDGCGVPSVEGWHISLSHTRGFAAVILSRTRRVAVDMEFVSRRVEHITSRFVRLDEQADNWQSQLVHWCVKETVFKLFTKESLKFFDMRLHPFPLGKKGVVQVDDLLFPKVQDVAYRICARFVITFAYCDAG